MFSPVSARFLHACRSSGRLVVTADIYIDDELVRTNAPVISYEVSADASADIRRSGRISIVNPARQDELGNIRSGGLTLPPLSPVVNIDLLNAELQLKAGFQYSSDQQELVPMGRFLIWSASLQYDEGDVYDMELYDRCKYLEQAEILKFFDFSGETAQDAIQALVDYALPDPQTVVFSAEVPNPTLPGGSIYDTNALQAVVEIADILGAEFFFDVLGNPLCQTKSQIDSTVTIDDSVFELNVHNPDAVEDGDEGPGNVISLGRTLTRDNVYNGVGVYGAQPDEDTDQPYAETFDLDPTSRTYYNGPFGKAFKRIDRPELLTDADCLVAAEAELARSITNAQPATIQILPNPALTPGDIVTVRYPDESVELHLLDSFDFDADTASMTVTTRGRAISGD